MADVSILEVLPYGEPIGTLTDVAGDRNLFAFDDSYIESAARPVLGRELPRAVTVRPAHG